MKKIFCSLLLTLILVPCISLAQESVPVELGDLHCDGSVNVIDAVLEVDRIIYQGWADSDDDGQPDVWDLCDNHYVEGMASNPLDMDDAYNIGFGDGVESVEVSINCFQSGFCGMAGNSIGEIWYSQNQHASLEECMIAGMEHWEQATVGGDSGSALLFAGYPAENLLDFLCTDDPNFGD